MLDVHFCLWIRKGRTAFFQQLQMPSDSARDPLPNGGLVFSGRNDSGNVRREGAKALALRSLKDDRVIHSHQPRFLATPALLSS